jgi:hypothetical protein
MRVLLHTLTLAPPLLALSALAVAGPLITGTQVSSGYSNLASVALLKASQQHSTALSRAGFIPAESLANATVGLEGQSARPGGRVRATRCEYWFRDGALNDIRRADLFEDKGPASLILRHLTNEVLTLKTQDAPGRALDLLRCLSYDADAIRNAYRITARDDLMDAHPVRNAGTNFPKDLHFFGELISRKKIHICVEFALQAPAPPTNRWERGNMQIEFLATTGELLKARFAGPDTLAALGIRAPERVAAIETPDFTPPVFFAASRKLTVPPATISTNDALALLGQAWTELQQKLGPNHAQCYLLSDNLNLPETIAHEFAKLARKTPWAGVCHFWRNDLPFDRAMMDELSHDRRGLGLLAICGKVQTQFDVIPDLADIPIPNNGDKASTARFTKDRERLIPLVTASLKRTTPAASMPDTALFMLQANPNFASRVVSGEFESATHAWAQVFEASGARPYNSIGDGVTYYNGAPLTNALVVLRLSGSLPLRMDPASLLRRMPERRLISGEVSTPITDLAYSFGPHPMQELFGVLGPDLIALLQQGERVEAFRIKSNGYNEQSVQGRPSLDGHEITARGTLQGPGFAKQLAAAILNDKNVLGVGAQCDFMPRDAFRVWRGKESALLLICFECHEIHLKYYDAAGKPVHEAGFYLGTNVDTLARLMKQAFPAGATPKKRKTKK